MTQKLCERIFNCPTAPFREGFVLATIEDILRSNKIPFFYDDAGNLFGGWNGSRKNKIKIAFMAHTDHPGFLITKQISERDLEAVWLGGAPFDQMKGKRVRVYSPHDMQWSAPGKIIEISKSHDHHGGIFLRIRLTKAVKIPSLAFGAFDFPGFKKSKQRIVTRAADDLAGCVIQLGAILDTYTEAPGRGVAVFTRAEEVGFIGCLAAIQNKSLPNVPFVSLEASKELEGAWIGKGPVLRLGDRTSMFDTSVSQALLNEAKKLELKKDFSFQRRIMDGGSCEATALNVMGYAAAGISVPLGNYHNQGKYGPAPEIISLLDVERGRKLCAQLIRNFKPGEWNNMMRTRFKTMLKQNKSKLKLASLEAFVRQSGRWPF